MNRPERVTQTCRHLAIGMLAACLVFATVSTANSGELRVIGYYPLWRLQESPLTDLPLHRLTHVNLAFAHIGTLGECRLSEDLPESDYRRTIKETLAVVRKAHPELKVCLSVGGWSRSGRFSDIAANAESRNTFVASCRELLDELQLDGVDIDWEFPVARWPNDNLGRPEDRENYVKLLAELRQAIGTDGTRSLTSAISAAPFHLEHLDLAGMMEQLDWINLMTYDQWGSWADRTGFHAPLGAPKLVDQQQANLRAHVASMLERGVAAEEIVVGIPLYGRGVVRANQNNRGMDQPHGGPAQGTQESEIFTYADLAKSYFPKFPAYWDSQASAGWLYSEQNGLMISFEDVRSVTAKIEYVRDQKLGGVMMWEITMDTEGPESLLQTIARGLRN